MYGIPNCDTIKKARKWLDAHNIEYRFHDYRKDGLTRKQLEQWEKVLGWEAMLNRRGTTWRKLPAETRDNIDRKSALTLLLEQPAMIKRPLLEIDNGNKLLLGFSEDNYNELLS
jgi:Spx/MgsR family transcriptional regulator